MPPSVTTSARFFICIGSTEVDRLDALDVDSLERLDESQNGVEFAAEALDLVVLDGDAREMGDAANGRGIDGHLRAPP